MNRSLVGAAVAFTLVVAAAGSGYLVRDRLAPAAPAPAQKPVPAAGPADSLQSAFVGVAQQVRPAVVNIGWSPTVLHLFQPKPGRFLARIKWRRTLFSTQFVT